MKPSRNGNVVVVRRSQPRVIQMATEQLQVIVGEWYWGVRCPECGAMAAHVPDPTRGQGDSKITSEKPSEAQVTLTCSNGHRFSVRTENLLRFEWGAQ
jgi:hypothetical protein